MLSYYINALAEKIISKTVIKSINPTTSNIAVKYDIVFDKDVQTPEIFVSEIGSTIAAVNFNNKEKTPKCNVGVRIIANNRTIIDIPILFFY